MMKKIALALLAVALVTACATSDDEPQPRYPQRGGGRQPMRDAAPQSGSLGLLPPPNWWRDPQISTAVKLSDSQFTALDAIAKDHAAEIDRLRMESTAAERDLRLLLNADKPTASDIVAAGQRVRTDRDQMLDHEVRMLAGERALLTTDQWTTLQDELRAGRDDFRRQR